MLVISSTSYCILSGVTLIENLTIKMLLVIKNFLTINHVINH